MRALEAIALRWTCTHLHCPFGCIHGIKIVLQLVLAVQFCPVMLEDCAIADACQQLGFHCCFARLWQVRLGVVSPSRCALCPMTRLSLLVEMVSVINAQLDFVRGLCAHCHREVGLTAPLDGLAMFGQTPTLTLLSLLSCREVTAVILWPKSTPEVVLLKHSVLSDLCCLGSWCWAVSSCRCVDVSCYFK